MSTTIPSGWQQLFEGHPRHAGEGRFPLPAYSEFMPPPRLGVSPYGGDAAPFSADDPYGWPISELEEEYELRPGLAQLAQEIVGEIQRLGRGQAAHTISGHRAQNLADNPYWPPELAARAGHLPHERTVVLLPLALARTQDDMGRVRWTLFGGSEQGPERAFWKSSFTAPDQEQSTHESLLFIYRLLASAYGEHVKNTHQLRAAGFRILPSVRDDQFPDWHVAVLPQWTQSFLLHDEASFDDVRYLLTFRPFSRLPADARARYLAGHLHLLPFPGSLAFWGAPTYRKLQLQLPLAMQIPLLRLAGRRGGPDGIRVPQSGWLHDPHPSIKPSDVQPELVANHYWRTHRWNRVHRYDDELVLSPRVDHVTKVLFSTDLDVLGLYNKPMARNAQLWTNDFELLLDGPRASRAQIERAEAALVAGGLFGYRFHFPAMRVGAHEVYWHRPLVAYVSPRSQKIEVLPDAPLGYLTAYRADAPDLSQPVELWPRCLRREPYLSGLGHFDSARDHYQHQTPLNIVSLLDAWHARGEQPLPRSFARHLLRIAKAETLDEWLKSLSERADDAQAGQQMRQALTKILEPAESALPEPITYAQTATRAFEEAWWQDIFTLAHGEYITKDNADPVQDDATRRHLTHDQRDLDRLAAYLLQRHRRAIDESGMDGKAWCGELPFRWRTDFDYPLFGGWQSNQTGHAHERDLLVVIPGKNRGEAIVLADHYDTAYMEDQYETARGGTGARLAAAGADDNHSATATLLLAAPVFLELAKAGRLERDVWLLHLTGEEFPADCLGARHFCQALVERTLALKTGAAQMNLSDARIVGVFVMDMIAHNRDNAQDIFQISPGKSRASLRLAWQAHRANVLWNAKTDEWNESAERSGLGRGRRSADGITAPAIAVHPRLHGEVRTGDDPQSSLYNTDGQIFSDVGVPVVLFMENYDINRTGYHDTHDTLELIDLDYGAALAAIAIETVARCATQAGDSGDWDY